MNRQQMNAPFAEEELQTFRGRGGQQMTYIEDETVMDRLDIGYGPGNWQIQVEAVSEQVVKVRLGVLESREWVWYEDFGYPNRTDGETLKEAVSDGIRRCGRYVGIARDLYRKDPTARRADVAPPVPHRDGDAPEPMPPPTPKYEETEELVGRLGKAGIVKKGTSESYKLDFRQSPDDKHTVGFRLEVDGDRAIPQVLCEGDVGEALYLFYGGKADDLLGKRVTVKGRLFNVKSPGRSTYFRLRVSDIQTPDMTYPAPEFPPDEQAEIDKALAAATT